MTAGEGGWDARSETPFHSADGFFRLVTYRWGPREHAALVNDDAPDGTPLVRVQSSCLTGTAFGAVLCDCRQQTELAMAAVAASGFGVVVYLAQEGRGHGLVEKVDQLALMATGLNTQEAALARRREPDVRSYDEAAAIVRDLLGARPVRLLTNNLEKVRQLEALGIEVAERVAIEADPEPGNTEYLRVKKQVLGHLLTKV